MLSPSRILSCSCAGLLLSVLQFHTVDASEPHFVDLNVDDTEPTFRFTSETTISGNLRASTTASSGQRPSFPASHQKHRHLAKVADWRPWPDNYINNIEVIHNLCDDEWISAVERACQAWTDRSDAVGLLLTAAQCNKKVNDDLTFIPGKIHVVYGTCGSDCCGKVSQVMQLGLMNEICFTSFFFRRPRGVGQDKPCSHILIHARLRLLTIYFFRIG